MTQVGGSFRRISYPLKVMLLISASIEPLNDEAEDSLCKLLSIWSSGCSVLGGRLRRGTSGAS